MFFKNIVLQGQNKIAEILPPMVSLHFDWNGAMEAWESGEIEYIPFITYSTLELLSDLDYVNNVWNDSVLFYSRDLIPSHLLFSAGNFDGYNGQHAFGIGEFGLPFLEQGIITIREGRSFTNDELLNESHVIPVLVSSWFTNAANLSYGDIFEMENAYFPFRFTEDGGVDVAYILASDNKYFAQTREFEIIGIFDIPPFEKYSENRAMFVQEVLRGILMIPQWGTILANDHMIYAVEAFHGETVFEGIDSHNILISLNNTSYIPSLINRSSEIFPPFFEIENRTDVLDLWMRLIRFERIVTIFLVVGISISGLLYIFKTRRLNNQLLFSTSIRTFIIALIATPFGFLLAHLIVNQLEFFPEWSYFAGGWTQRFYNVRPIDYFINYRMDLAYIEANFPSGLSLIPILQGLGVLLLIFSLSWLVNNRKKATPKTES